MNRMISAMGLAGFEADYFKALVNFCNAKGDDAKMPYWKEMRQIAKTCCNEISAADVSKSLELRLASESIERFEPQDRRVSSVTLTVNRECYERIA